MDEREFSELGTIYLHWYGPATFLHCPFKPDLKDTDIGLIGVPYSGGNPVERMQYLAPRAVRNRSAAYHRAHREFGINPFDLVRVRDLDPGGGDSDARPTPRSSPVAASRTSSYTASETSRRAQVSLDCHGSFLQGFLDQPDVLGGTFGADRGRFVF